MRKVQDHYFHRARKESYPARSVYKLEEADARYRFIRPGKRRVLDLGCHPGSWSIYCSRKLGERGLVVGVDIQDAEFAGTRGEADMVRLARDVYDPELVRELRRRWHGFHVVLSDMAPQTTGNTFSDHQLSMRLMERALEIARALLHPGGAFYCKGFQGEDFPAFVRTCKPLFAQVRVVKPDSSRRESREVFVLGTGFGRAGQEAGSAGRSGRARRRGRGRQR